MATRMLLSNLVNEKGALGDAQKIGPSSGGGPTPSGAISITENGTYDVAQYAEAEVNVSTGGGDQTISFLDWVQQGSNYTGAFVNADNRIACKHMLFKCKSISIPSGVQFALGAASMPTIDASVAIHISNSSFLGFWDGTAYITTFTWFDSPTFDLTQIHDWSDNYVIMFLRHQDNSPISVSEGNPVVVTYDFADGAFVR